MRLKTKSIVLLLTIVALAGCGGSASEEDSGTSVDSDSSPKADTHLTLLSEMTDLMEEVHAIVETVDDEASANAAAEKIEKLQPKGESITQRLEALEDPPEEEMERLEELTREEVDALLLMIDEVTRIGSRYPKLRSALNATIPAF